MSYLVLARKWRPMRFEDLVGQDHVARTLKNAIDSNRVAHAFLFTGVRGVGKTTSARILAKALNCMGDPETTPAGTDPGPTSTPCLRCAACQEITLGTDLDVREIDGASYNGVDEVRKLQDSLPYRPARDRFKVFIVDEVHMLSQNAWNAFLKTLEEPPPHVKFIFATTEVHKVPVTILSRVQRFDFKLITTQQIAERLRWVLEKEGIQADDAALAILSREAAGSMRDAMSLLDQVIAWSGDALRGDDVAQVLGVASHQALSDLARALMGGDALGCLKLVAELGEQGHDMVHLARDVLGRLRDLVVAKVGGDAERLLDLPDSEAPDIRELSNALGLDDLLRLHQGFAEGYDLVARSGQPRAALEMLLVRLARRPPLLPVETLVTRLLQLEKRLGGASAGPLAPGQRGPSPERVASGSARPREMRAAEPAREARREDEPKEPPAAAETALSTTPEAEAEDLLRAIVARLASGRPDLAAKLEHAVLLESGSGKLVLGWAAGDVCGELMAAPEATAAVEQIASALLETPTRVVHERDSARVKGKKTLSHLELQARERRTREAYEKARRHPRVVDAEQILGARLRDLKLGPTS